MSISVNEFSCFVRGGAHKTSIRICTLGTSAIHTQSDSRGDAEILPVFEFHFHRLKYGIQLMAHCMREHLPRPENGTAKCQARVINWGKTCMEGQMAIPVFLVALNFVDTATLLLLQNGWGPAKWPGGGACGGKLIS